MFRREAEGITPWAFSYQPTGVQRWTFSNCFFSRLCAIPPVMKCILCFLFWSFFPSCMVLCACPRPSSVQV